MAFKAGNLCKVTIGTDTIKGMGTWELPGVTTELLETTSFGDTAKQYITGMVDYGNMNFAGLYDPADSTGQSVLISANLNNSKLANVRAYVDSASYWVANVTAVSASGLLIQSWGITADKAGVVQIKFTGKCTGPWVLV